jgi:hypothetical protein
MNELTPEQFEAIKNFAEGLKTCFENRKKDFHYPLFEITIDYVLKVMDIHLELKELEVQRYALNLEKEFMR